MNRTMGATFSAAVVLEDTHEKQSFQVNRRDVALAFKTTFLSQENKRTDTKDLPLRLKLLGSPSITEEIQKIAL